MNGLVSDDIKDNIPPSSDASNKDVIYAGFWFRVAAMLCDQAFIWTALYVFFFIAGMLSIALTPLEWTTVSSIGEELRAIEDETLAVSDADIKTRIVYYGENLVYIFVAIIYHTVTEASKLRGSVGKYILRVRVLDKNLQPIGIKRALLRNCMAWILGILTLTIGHWFAGFTPKKRALHDMVAGTIIIRES